MAAAVVFGLSARGSLDQTPDGAGGIGVSAGGAALTTLMIVGTEPWNQTRAITWLGGSTFGATWDQQAPMAVALVLAAAVLAGARRDLDLLQLDEQTPRVLGIEVGRARLTVLAAAMQLPAGLVTALVGAPYCLWLLARAKA